jgi:hypothetical protein
MFGVDGGEMPDCRLENFRCLVAIEHIDKLRRRRFARPIPPVLPLQA